MPVEPEGAAVINALPASHVLRGTLRNTVTYGSGRENSRLARPMGGLMLFRKPHLMKPENSLRAVKLVHTLIWAVLAGCILAIPVVAYTGRVEIAGILIGIVFVEGIVLLVNGWRCPLTDVASRFTSNRSDNFDIYLPVWLAKYNKGIFGTLFIISLLYTLYSLLRSSAN